MDIFKQGSLVILLSAFILAISPAIHAAQLMITIDNVKTYKGTIYIAIFAQGKDYENDTNAIREVSILVDSAIHAIVIEDLPEREYAVKLMHDENDNGKLDTNFLGIPKEGYGFSNNGGKFGPPTFEKALFELGEEEQITISLH